MKSIMKKIEDLLLPITNRIASNNYIIALRDGMIVSMPLLIVGSLLLVITEIPIDAYQNAMQSMFGEGWKWFSDIAVNATIGLIAMFAIIGISKSLAENFKKDVIMAVAISLSAYFVILVQVDEGGYALKDFGAKGLFSAMIIAMISTRLYCWIIDKKITIKMPESVPYAISKSFEALIPAAIIIPLFLIIRLIFALTPYESVNNFIFNVLQMPLTGVACTFGGILFSTFMSHFLWFFGIHGASVVGSVMSPMFQAASLENLEAFQAGLAPVNIVTQQFNDVFQTYGGVGSTLALTFIMAFVCKSKQLRTLGRLSMIPGIFGINEPIVFGLPLVLNPMLMIPFFLTPLLNVSLAYFATSVGWIGITTGVQVTWSIPPFISGILGTNTLSAGILQIVSILLSILIYFPFIMAYDKKLLLEENSLAELENEDTANAIE